MGERIPKAWLKADTDGSPVSGSLEESLISLIRTYIWMGTWMSQYRSHVLRAGHFESAIHREVSNSC